MIIEENSAVACNHHYDAIDVIEDKVGHAGEEEIDQIELELLDLELHRLQKVENALNKDSDADLSAEGVILVTILMAMLLLMVNMIVGLVLLMMMMMATTILNG